MKYVVLSADSARKVYAVPDVVADNLSAYCMEFCTKWLVSNPSAKKYRVRGGLCFNEDDFVEYLNAHVFPDQQSHLIENLGWIDFGKPLPEPYCDYPAFNF